MGYFARLRATMLALALATMGVAAAVAQTPTPFQPLAPPKPKWVRLLAYTEYFDPETLEAFQRQTGFEVAYDAYTSAVEISDRLRDGPYDLVVLPGPDIARGARSGAWRKLDRARIVMAKSPASALLAKFAAYDRDGAFSLPLGWSPFGLIYDSDKAMARLGGAPVSWSALLDARISRKMSDCGVSLPDARSSLFLAAWRLLKIDPARVGPVEVRSASILIERAKPALQGFEAADIVGPLARGAQCLAAGTPGQAAAALARANAAGVAAKIKFALPVEGASMAMDALAIPVDAPSPDAAYALASFLLRPEIAERNARFAGVTSALDAPDPEMLKRLWPEGAYDDKTAAAIDAEWQRLLKSQ